MKEILCSISKRTAQPVHDEAGNRRIGALFRHQIIFDETHKNEKILKNFTINVVPLRILKTGLMVQQEIEIRRIGVPF